MTLAIMQPYLFPYIGYWQLINSVDTFVVYDNIQFTKKGWIHRNNILINNKKKLFTIPLKNDSDYLNIEQRYLADDAENKIKKIIAQIENSYKKAPYFEMVYPLIVSILLNQEKNLFKYIFHSIQQICNYLDINTTLINSSTIPINHNLKSENKVIELCKTMNATHYINPIGGIPLYNSDNFNSRGITLKFLTTQTIEYPQFIESFESSMSIIDIMMFNSKAQIKIMLNQYDLKSTQE